MLGKTIPAKSAEDLEEKRKAVVILCITHWTIGLALHPGTLEDKADRLADSIIARLHESECWGEFKG